MTIGQRIAELRKKHNLSQEALGEELGVSRQSVSKWESDAALPEIDKLIALSKRFGVPVGVLLGVEEETARQAQAQPEREGPTEAEVLQQYLDSLPKRKPISKKWRVLCALAVAVFLFMTIDYIDTLESRINSLHHTVNNMSHQMANVQSELYGISDDISTQIDQALKQEYGLLASWTMELVGLDYQQGAAEVKLSAVLKNKVSSAEELSFYARLADGSYVTCHTAQWDEVSGGYTAQVTLPIDQNKLAYYLSTPEGIVCLADRGHNLCYLADNTALQVTLFDSIWSGGRFQGSEKKSGYVQGSVDLYMEEPWMYSEHFDQPLGEPGVSLWLMLNGERLMELELTETLIDDHRWEYQGTFHLSDDVLLPQEGDKLWVEYEVVFAGGLSASGADDTKEVLIYNGTTWGHYEE